MGLSVAGRLEKGVVAAGLILALAMAAGAAQAQRGGGGPGGGLGRGGLSPSIGAQLHGPSFAGQGAGPGFQRPSTDDPSPGSLRDVLFGSHAAERRALPPVARFRVDGGDDFILDRGAGSALLKFEDSPEVWALTATAGPRGDTIFKNDVGDPVLRMTRLGGMTLFTDSRPDGMAVSMAGIAQSVRPNTTIGPNVLWQAMAQSSLRASRAAQHLIAFEAPAVTPKTDWLFADAAMVTSEAFIRLVTQMPDGRALAARFARVEFLTGAAVQAAAQGQVVQITLVPSKGVAGRPSSERIFLVLRRR